MALADCAPWVWLDPGLDLGLAHGACVARGSGGPLWLVGAFSARMETLGPRSLGEACAACAPRPRSGPVLFCATVARGLCRGLFLPDIVWVAHMVLSLGRCLGLAWVDDWGSLG